MRKARSHGGVPPLVIAMLTLSGCASLLDIEEGQLKPSPGSGGGAGATAGGSAGSQLAGGKAGAGAVGGGAAGTGQGGAGQAGNGASGGTTGGGATGATGGASGASAGQAGAGAGTGGSAGGQGGISAGSGGAPAGNGGSAGNGGAGGTTSGSAGVAGTTSGAGGAGGGLGGSGGAAGEAGGVAGAGGSLGGSGGGVAGGGGALGGSAGTGGGGPLAVCTLPDTCATPGKACTPGANSVEIPVPQIVAGERFSCALAYHGNRTHVYCWGDNGLGQLGRPTSAFEACPVAMEVPLAEELAQITNTTLIAGPTAQAACVVGGAKVACWGDIGGVSYAPSTVLTLPNGAAMANGGSVGRNFLFVTSGFSPAITYALGPAQYVVAMQVDAPSATWKVVTGAPTMAASSAASCAAKSQGAGASAGYTAELTCAGTTDGCLLASTNGACQPAGSESESFWSLGIGGFGGTSPDVEMSDSVGCVNVGSGGAPQALRCWGKNLGSAGNSPVPTEVAFGGSSGSGGSFGSVSFGVGEGFVAQARSGGGVQISGSIPDENDNPITLNQTPPFVLQSSGRRQIAAGRSHVCAVANSGGAPVVQCVGSNARRQAGNTQSSAPSKMARTVSFQLQP